MAEAWEWAAGWIIKLKKELEKSWGEYASAF
jgi:hypothetical protein